MNSESLVVVFLVAGFLAAPFASLSVRRPLARIAATVLLMAVLSILGCFGFAFDRGYLLPEAWEACGLFVLAGLGISIFVYKRHRFRPALVFGGALVIAVMGLHLFAMDFVRTCQRACFRIREGMDARQVKNIILAEFAKRSDYRVVVGPEIAFESRDGYMSFDLRPLYARLPPESLQVGFANGRASKAWTSAVQSPLSGTMVWELIGTGTLCAVCVSRLCFATKKARDVTAVITFDVLQEKLQHIREQHYVWHPAPDRSVLAKRMLMHRAGQKIRQLAFFGCRGVECQPDVEPKL